MSMRAAHGMGHIVFAAPSISRFPLHHRLRRDLLRRGHRVSILCTDRCRFTFWREQVSDVNLVEATGRPDGAATIQASEAQIDAPEHRKLWQKLCPAVTNWLERERPDLVLFHQERSVTTACIQFAARTVGCRVLWTGDGLLAHTMQVDARGIDADASIRRWTAEQFSVVEPDDALLHTSLTHALADAEPLALPRPTVLVPPLRRRIADATHYASRARFQTAMTALHGWRMAFATETSVRQHARLLDLQTPFVAVLLQDREDARIVHDAGEAPSMQTLVQRALIAADTITPGTQVVVVLPDGVAESPALANALAGAHADRIRIASASHAATIAATSAATITVNHPTAIVALLCGTPVIHLGRALYELPGVTQGTTLQALPEAVAIAMQNDKHALRRPFLTWLLRHGHVWCSATAPNHNGMLGLVQVLERQLQGDAEPSTRPLAYRPGPTWPLAMP